MWVEVGELRRFLVCERAILSFNLNFLVPTITPTFGVVSGGFSMC